LDSQDRAAFEDVEFLILYAYGEFLQKPWLPLTAGVILRDGEKIKIRTNFIMFIIVTDYF